MPRSAKILTRDNTNVPLDHRLWRSITPEPMICFTLDVKRHPNHYLKLMLAGGKSVEDVLAAYPELEAVDVRQAMQDGFRDNGTADQRLRRDCG